MGTFGWQASGWVTHLGSVLYLNGLAVGSASCRVFSLFRFKLCALLIFSGYSLLTLEMEGDWVNGQPEAWGSGGGLSAESNLALGRSVSQAMESQGEGEVL